MVVFAGLDVVGAGESLNIPNDFPAVVTGEVFLTDPGIDVVVGDSLKFPEIFTTFESFFRN
jgi:hypothetical protein